jgi:hypothetical protein
LGDESSFVRDSAERSSPEDSPTVTHDATKIIFSFACSQIRKTAATPDVKCPVERKHPTVSFATVEIGNGFNLPASSTASEPFSACLHVVSATI